MEITHDRRDSALDDDMARRIAAIEATDSAAAQALMQRFAEELSRAELRVAGLIQTSILDGATGRKRVALRDLATGKHYMISQDLGPGSVACNLDSDALAMACASVERMARDGADLIVISKFSKQEADRGGLADAFKAAISARIPILTAVSPFCVREWKSYAGPLAEFTPATIEGLRDWWRSLRGKRRRS